MADRRIKLSPGALQSALVERTRHALACGAMERIETVEELVEDGGVRFVVRKVSSLVRKDEDTKLEQREAGARSNPFLPHEPDLFVAEVSGTHFALLNKFNVVDHHLLIVTRSFVHQETLLDRDDFAALAACMAQFDGLGFYNGGEVAGASQPHKHLQLVPLPLSERGQPIPVEPLFDAIRGGDGIASVPRLAFAHAFAWTEPSWFGDAGIAAERLHALYRELLAAAGIGAVEAQGEARQSAPYNLLLARCWMLLVPRSKEHFDSISVNALGFAGSLFVRNEEQLRAVKRAGPMAVLEAVAMP